MAISSVASSPYDSYTLDEGAHPPKASKAKFGESTQLLAQRIPMAPSNLNGPASVVPLSPQQQAEQTQRFKEGACELGRLGIFVGLKAAGWGAAAWYTQQSPDDPFPILQNVPAGALMVVGEVVIVGGVAVTHVTCSPERQPRD